jgi:GTP-binding protein Era
LFLRCAIPPAPTIFPAMSVENTSTSSGDGNTRSGYVTLIGKPNAGKSTLMNALIGERLSIVTPKAQTTWQRITGILTHEDVQVIFLDTPGLLEPRDLLQRTMLSAALEALSEADVILLVLDTAEPFSEADKELLKTSLAEAPKVPLLVALNKTDLAHPDVVRDVSDWVQAALGAEAFPLSALEETGLAPLLSRLREVTPPGPHLYPADEIARDPVRFFVGEMIRETVFQEYFQEIPYSTFCQIGEFREGETPVYIQAHLYVERNSQKRILIGKGGASIRNLGTLSRKKIEDFLGKQVYLDLWVKVLSDWRRRRGHLKQLGFQVPEEDKE